MKHDIIKPSFVREDPRGIFQEIMNGSAWKSVNTGSMRKGAVLGNHYHTTSRVFFFMLSGKTRVDYLHAKTKERDSVELNTNEGVYLNPFESHAITFLSDGIFLMLKSELFDQANSDIHPLKVT